MVVLHGTDSLASEPSYELWLLAIPAMPQSQIVFLAIHEPRLNQSLPLADVEEVAEIELAAPEIIHFASQVVLSERGPFEEHFVLIVVDSDNNSSLCKICLVHTNDPISYGV